MLSFPLATTKYSVVHLYHGTSVSWNDHGINLSAKEIVIYSLNQSQKCFDAGVLQCKITRSELRQHKSQMVRHIV
jgi:hypothetical protein